MHIIDSSQKTLKCIITALFHAQACIANYKIILIRTTYAITESNLEAERSKLRIGV